jgi:hypothetical protein
LLAGVKGIAVVMPEARVYLVLAEDKLFSLSPQLCRLPKGLVHQIIGVTLQPGTADYSQNLQFFLLIFLTFFSTLQAPYL